MNAVSRVYIFCSSYGEIKRTLYLAERFSRERSVTVVIPVMHDLYRFFQEINIKKVLPAAIDIIYFESYTPARAKARGINKLFYVIPDIIRERRYLREIYHKYFAGVEGCDVYFCARGFDGYLFYLAKKLSRKNRLVNTSPSPPQLPSISEYFPSNITDLAKLIVHKLTYGRDVALGKLPHVRGFIFMTDKFMKKVVNRFISWEEMDEMLKDFDYSRYRVFETGRYRVIYFDDSALEAGFITDKELYRKELNDIFNILIKHFPEKEIARKYHPSYPDDKTLVKSGDVLPDFIPAELLYDDKVAVYLSIGSLSLANVEKGQAVSIADLITFRDESDKKLFKDTLVKMGKSAILFPKSLDEFERIIADIKEHRT